jgi:hypothetical protein
VEDRTVRSTATKLTGLCAALGAAIALAGSAGAQMGMPCHHCFPKGTMTSDPAWLKDAQTLLTLLDYRKYIRRQVTKLSSGVETVTESGNAALAAKIQEHAEATKRRLEEGKPLLGRDPLFVALARNAPKIRMTVERTEKGVRVIETSDDPYVVKLIQAEARAVGLLLKNGRPELMKAHATPRPEKAK